MSDRINKRLLIILALGASLVGLCVLMAVVVWLALGPGRGTAGRLFSGLALTATAETTEQKTLTVTTPANLDVETPFGDISITGGSGSQIEISAKKQTLAATQARAEQALKDLKVDVQQAGNKVTIRVITPPGSFLDGNQPNGSVDFTIRVPTETTVEAHSSTGKVALKSTAGKAIAGSDFGSVTVTDFKGGLVVSSNNGDVTASNIGRLPSGDGDISLHSDFGALRLENADTQRVEASSNNGSVTLVDVQSAGPLTLTSKFGRLSYKGGSAQTLKATSDNGDVTLGSLKIGGQVTVAGKFGGITLNQVQAQSYDLSSDNGAISVNGAAGPVKAHSSFGDITITDGEQANLDLSTKNGAIEYRGSLAAGSHQVNSDFGSINLVLPAGAGFHFDLKTDFGKIQVDFPFNIQGAPDEKHWVGSAGGASAGSGGVQIAVETRNGGIRIEQGK